MQELILFIESSHRDRFLIHRQSTHLGYWRVRNASIPRANPPRNRRRAFPYRRRRKKRHLARPNRQPKAPSSFPKRNTPIPYSNPSSTNTSTSAKSVSASTAPTSPKTTPSPSASSLPKTATPNPPLHPESAAGKPPQLHLSPQQQSARHHLPLTSHPTMMMKSFPPIIILPPHLSPSCAKSLSRKTKTKTNKSASQMPTRVLRIV